ncbi:MAG: hypothetical protein WCW63_03165 [Acholeplasmataceae bacterium]
MQYKINRDPKTGKFLNLEFVSGEFIGVSVLGKDEQPAFTGSEFFSNEFVKKFEQIKGYCENRGGKMDLRIPTFVEQSWNEVQKEVSVQLYEKYGYDFFYIQDMYNDYCVAYMWDTEKEVPYLVKITYLVVTDDQEIQVDLGEPVPVRVVYEEIKNVELTSTETEVESTSTEMEVESTSTEMEVESTSTEMNVELTSTETKVKANEENTVNTSLLSDVEREELETYRKQAKISLIQEYKDTIPTVELDVYIQNVDNYDRISLENTLNKRFVEIAKNTPKQETKNNRFIWAPEPSSQSEPLTEAEKLAKAIRERKNRGTNNA